jgi:hypothetical protein
LPSAHAVRHDPHMDPQSILSCPWWVGAAGLSGRRTWLTRSSLRLFLFPRRSPQKAWVRQGQYRGADLPIRLRRLARGTQPQVPGACRVLTPGAATTGVTGLTSHAYVFAVIMPPILVAILAAPLGVAWTIARLRQGPSNVTTPLPLEPNATAGEPGLGDPYYPQAGNSGYDVSKYQIMINFDPGTQSITGTTTISAQATQQLNSFYFDLALHADKATVNAAPAESVRRGFSEVYVEPAQEIAAGSTFQVVVAYSGKPGEHRQGDVQPWFATDGEWTIAGEPRRTTTGIQQDQGSRPSIVRAAHP